MVITSHSDTDQRFLSRFDTIRFSSLCTSLAQSVTESFISRYLPSSCAHRPLLPWCQTTMRRKNHVKDPFSQQLPCQYFANLRMILISQMRGFHCGRLLIGQMKLLTQRMIQLSSLQNVTQSVLDVSRTNSNFSSNPFFPLSIVPGYHSQEVSCCESRNVMEIRTQTDSHLTCHGSCQSTDSRAYTPISLPCHQHFSTLPICCFESMKMSQLRLQGSRYFRFDFQLGHYFLTTIRGE